MIFKTKKTKPFRSLWVTLAIAFLALSALVLLISSSLNMYFSFQTQQKLITNEQKFIAQNAADTVQSFIQEKFSTLKAAAHLSNPVETNQEGQNLILEKLLGLEPAFRQAILLNAKEERLAKVSRLSSLVSGQLTERISSSLFSQASQVQTYIGSVYIDEITSEPLVIMAASVTDIFGDFKGILLAEVNLKFMWDLVGNIKVGNKGLAYVVDERGNLLAAGDISRVLRGENLAHLKEVNEFVMGDTLTHKDSAEIVKGIQGNYVVANHVHLGTPDWAVIVELPVLEAYETVITTLIVSGLILLLSFALAIIFGIYLSKRITKPITSLKDAAARIGEGKLDIQIEIKKKDEIGVLAAAFNQMAHDLQRTTTSVDNLNWEINERKKAEKSLEKLNKDLKSTVALLTQSNRQLQEFTYLAAHDLKTPLRGISTIAQWLVDDYQEKFDDEGRQQINLLVKRVTRISELINAILQYSTIARNRHKECPVDLNTLVETVLIGIEPPPNIEITFNKELPVVICGEKHIQQVFYHLLTNAIKFMDRPDGHITIDYTDKGDLWEFSVSDNGPGIAPQHFERIFQLFQILGDRDQSEGIGMGLTLVRKIVEMYSGKIEIKSNIGEGSTFFFTLPKQEMVEHQTLVESR